MAITPRQPGDKVQSASVNTPTARVMDGAVYDPAGHKQDVFGYVDRKIDELEEAVPGMAPVQSVVTKTGDVTLANIMGDVAATGPTTSYPSACGRFAVTANIFSNMSPVSYSGVLTIERRDTYQRHMFTSSQGEVYVGWNEGWTVAEPASWSKVGPPTYSAVSSSTVSVNSGTDTAIKSVSLTPGFYIFNFGASFAANETGSRLIAIATSTAASNAAYSAGQKARALSGETTWISLTTVFQVTSTTTYYCIARQNSGSALNVTGAYRYIKLA